MIMIYVCLVLFIQQDPKVFCLINRTCRGSSVPTTERENTETKSEKEFTQAPRTFLSFDSWETRLWITAVLGSPELSYANIVYHYSISSSLLKEKKPVRGRKCDVEKKGESRRLVSRETFSRRIVGILLKAVENPHTVIPPLSWGLKFKRIIRLLKNIFNWKGPTRSSKSDTWPCKAPCPKFTPCT